jgi:hypothetical protein
VLAPPTLASLYKTGLAEDNKSSSSNNKDECAVVPISRPIELPPGKDLELAYDSWCSGLCRLRISDELDPTKAEFVW